MRRREWRPVVIGIVLATGLTLVTASVAVPIILLSRLDDAALGRWSATGQALEPVGVFFSGVAFLGIALTLFLQSRELHNQREELAITREEQQRNSEVALRQLHTDLIKMAINDRELREVWPPISPGVVETKEDFFTAEVDRAYTEATAPKPKGLAYALRRTVKKSPP